MKSFRFLDLTTNNVFIYSDVLKLQKMIYKVQGWEFALCFFGRIVCFLWVKDRNSDLLFSKERIPIFLFFKERREQIAHGSSFVKNYARESLPSLLKKIDEAKSHGAKSDGSNLLLGIKSGKAVKNCQKHDENYAFFEQIARFL